ncbi:reverse transcriptase [Tanacetum coccineum]
MKTRHAADLKKILETIEADKKEMAQKMQVIARNNFKICFYPGTMRGKISDSFSQLHSLRQGTGTAEEYSREFEYLLMKCDVPEDDPQTLVRYLGALEPRVANVVEFHSYQTLTELTLLFHKVDSQQRSKGKFEPTRQSFRPTTYSKPTSTHKTTTPTNSQPSMIPNPKSEPSKAPRRCFEFESDLVASPESPHDDEVEVPLCNSMA